MAVIPNINPGQMTGEARPITAQQVVDEMPVKQAIGVDEIRKAYETLRKYKKGKSNYEDKIVRNERWWKMRHWDMLETPEMRNEPKPASGWLFNTIISKHADYMDSFPKSNILPREMGDIEEAKRLSSIIPVVMQQNGYKKVYSDEAWYKLKHGTGVYGVFWDQSKNNGLGDISLKSMDILGLYWEPGITDIQKSRNFFSVELVDDDILRKKYPQMADQLSQNPENILKKYWYDENIDTSGKQAVIDWYYKKTNSSGKQVLHYCKFCGEQVLYATENDTQVPTETVDAPMTDENGRTMVGPDGMPMVIPQEVPTGEPAMSERGLYDHGLYPFVFDVLFPEAGLPVGFGFVDVCKQPQTSIDILNNCFEKNAQFLASPRYLIRNDGGLNEDEFSDPYQMLVHTDSNLGQDSYIPIAAPAFVNGNYITLLDQKIQEMKETTGNRDSNNGGSSAGVTAASAIAAMQESSGKTSRDQISRTYEAHKEVVNLVIELIRQFYDMPRVFRIIGEGGQQEFTTYNNAGLQPQHQGVEFGVDMGYRLPVFDIEISAEKDSPYSQLSQNEMALQFYNSGFFAPERSDAALACIDMMEFQGKQKVTERIQQNGTIYQMLLQTQQMMLQMAQMVDQLSGGQSNLAEMTAEQINNVNGGMAGGAAMAAAQMPKSNGGEASGVAKARQQTQESTTPR